MTRKKKERKIIDTGLSHRSCSDHGTRTGSHNVDQLTILHKLIFYSRKRYFFRFK